MKSEIICVFHRNSKCIFKGGLCDQDCDHGKWDGNIRSDESLLEKCLEGGNRKLGFSRKVVNLFLQFP